MSKNKILIVSLLVNILSAFYIYKLHHKKNNMTVDEYLNKHPDFKDKITYQLTKKLLRNREVVNEAYYILHNIDEGGME